jgi:hypothetical protein
LEDEMKNARKIRSVGDFITKKIVRTLNMLKRFGMFKKGLLMDKLKRNELGEFSLPFEIIGMKS